jgi:putative DNA primase/helicase
MKQYEQELERWETRKKAFMKKAERSGEDSFYPEPKPERPAARRFIVNDSSLEKMHEILNDNPQGVLYCRDELTGWFAELDTKGRERDRPFFLEAWNGDGSYTIDRIGRGTLHVPHLCLSVLGGIQPSKLQDYIGDATIGGVEDDGLAQRLQMLVWPDVSSTWRRVDRPANSAAYDAIESAFLRIVQMPVDPQRILRFSSDAQQLFNTWRKELEHRVRSGSLPSALEAHHSKYRSLMPSLAAIFHVVDAEQEDRVSLLNVQRAAQFCSYLESHARRVYSCTVSLGHRLASQLARHIKAGELGARFTVRDVYINKWAGLGTKEAVLAALSELEDAGWVRRIKTKTGGRPTDIFLVNPAVVDE